MRTGNLRTPASAPCCRARTLGRTDGLVKVLPDPASGLVLGVGIVGVSASELIAEATLAARFAPALAASLGAVQGV